MKVLVAEDDGTARLLLQRSVEALGHDCLLARDGEEAWRLYDEQRPDVVISDWMMPGIDGLELCRRMRRAAMLNADCVYIIMLTAMSNQQNFIAAMDEGADDYLTKPLDRTQLRVRLRVAERVTTLYRDLMEQKEHFEHHALHDSLTGLANRVLFQDRMNQAISLAARDRSCFAVLLLDLDGFKLVNDTQGHEAGDALLREVACRLQQVVRASDTVARLGGDEFAILLPYGDREAAAGIATRVLDLLREPILVAGAECMVAASIGLALFPEQAATGEDLLRRADGAMYAAKQTHAGFAAG